MKNKYIAVITATLALLFALCLSAGAAGNQVLIGDINQDNRITTDDARRALQFATELKKPTAEQFDAADIDRDGQITIDDVRAIMLISAKVIEPQHHQYTDWVTVLNSTCKTEGKAVCHCTVCGEEKVKSLPKSAHNYSSATCTTAAICTVCGQTSGKALGHKFGTWVTTVKSTCMNEGKAVATCSVCGAQQTKTLPKSDHILKNATCASGAVCTVCGQTFGAALGHEYENGVCVRCGEGLKLDETGDYVYTNGKIIKFGANSAKVKSLLGTPTEKLKLDDYTVQVFAKDYTNLIIILLRSDKVSAIYTNSTDAVVNSDNERVTFSSAGRKKTIDDLTVTFYVDNFSKNINQKYALLAQYTDTSFTITATNSAAQEKISYYITNGCRAINGLPAYKYNDALANTAYNHSVDMAENDYTSHYDPSGKSPADRITADNISWFACGENIAAGYLDAFAVTDAWYNSIDHRDNILDTDFNYVGIGIVYVPDSKWLYYSTQNYIGI